MLDVINIEDWLSANVSAKGVRRDVFSNLGLAFDSFCVFGEEESGRCKAIYRTTHGSFDKEHASRIMQSKEQTLFDAVAKYAKRQSEEGSMPPWEIIDSYGLSVPDAWYLSERIGPCVESEAWFRAVVGGESVRIFVTEDDEYYAFAIQQGESLWEARSLVFIGERRLFKELVAKFYPGGKNENTSLEQEIAATQAMLKHLHQDLF